MFDFDNNPTHKRIHAAVTKYLGGHIETIDLVADPEVQGVFAIRVTAENDDYATETLDFLLNTNDWSEPAPNETHVMDWAALEETEYTSWPPKSGQLRF